MKNDYIVLSLDPMFSPLHSKIAHLIGRESYAITSCWSKQLYLRGFRKELAQKMINKISVEEANPYLDTVGKLESYYHFYVEKIEKRHLNEEELIYMAKFYMALERYIKQHDISLVLLHNDTRWYHAIAVSLCKKLNIEYLVTEQGLIRPHTTVLDRRGCNVNAEINYLSGVDYRNIAPRTKVKVTDKHDSLRSICMFGVFLLYLMAEKWLRRDSVLSYMHNDYSIAKYIRRLRRKLFARGRKQSYVENKTALLFLQLENDSQIVQHSSYNSNEQIIKLVGAFCEKNNLNLVIKKHPLDPKSYSFSNYQQFVDGDNKILSKQADLVITVNSSAVIDVLDTNTPLILLGKSIYARRGLGIYWSGTEESTSVYQKAIKNVCTKERENFLAYLANNYLLTGAGASYQTELLVSKLDFLLEKDVGSLDQHVANNSVA
ncbi:capsular polysaccharide export protein, LipB/KpsS family [Vibrio panuliri]|uniref:Capsule biosynthesis protein n=1 Tax=Vibrio panuliri TaxID=1381081 RepID=A0ABX3F6R0_9VIBR|nr:hypothetical protein [Vibrio panuliri]KAB1457278.1 phosphoribosylamine--glycine ligase [Vibrio panuliri]OLQ85958.1 hypothetical protein BIY20_15655 [Vibrio panuliri]